MTAISGRNLLDSYESLGRVGLLAKTLLDTSIWASMTCYLTWKDLATPGRRLLFRLAPSTPRIDAIESGLLPTASAQESGPMPELNHEPKLNARNYSKKTGKHCQMTLSRYARLWPTPTSSEGTGAQPNKGRRGGKSLTGGTTLPGAVGGQLSPTWVEWLMGYPSGWTDLEDSEMQSSRRSQK